MAGARPESTTQDEALPRPPLIEPKRGRYLVLRGLYLRAAAPGPRDRARLSTDVDNSVCNSPHP